MKITIISGSPRKGSLSNRAALLLKRELEAKGRTVDLIDVREHVLPMVQTVWTSEELVPEEYQSLYQRMNASDAFILVTPEYNGGYSPAMKNLLDHFPKSTYARKPIGISTASNGAFGGMRAAQQMQQMVCAFFGIPSPHMFVVPLVDKKIDADGVLLDESFQSSVDRFTSEFAWLADSLYLSVK